METETTIKIEENAVDPNHVGAFRVKLLTAGEEIGAGIRMTVLSGGLGMHILPTTFHNMIWHISYIEQFVIDGPDWFYREVDGEKRIINLLDLKDTPIIATLFSKWQSWRSLLPGFQNPQGVGAKTSQPSEVATGEDPGDDD